MKILFLGASRGCGTTSSMAAVASYCALHSSYRSFCMQLKEGGGDLEQFFRPWEKRPVLKEESTYYVLEGMDYLIWQEQHHRLDFNCMKESMVPLLDYRMFYLPGGAREKPVLYPEQTGELQKRIVLRLADYADLLFIDLGCGRDALTNDLLHTADVVVVNFSGESEELEEFFCRPLRCSGKLLYLLANYSDDQVYNSANLKRIYRLDENSICVLPSNPSFSQACTQGRMEQFMKRSWRIHCSQRSEQFLRELGRVSNLIMEAGANG